MSSRNDDYQDDSNYGSSNTGRGSSGIAASDEPARVRGEYEQNPNTTTGGGRGGGDDFQSGSSGSQGHTLGSSGGSSGRDYESSSGMGGSSGYDTQTTGSGMSRGGAGGEYSRGSGGDVDYPSGTDTYAGSRIAQEGLVQDSSSSGLAGSGGYGSSSGLESSSGYGSSNTGMSGSNYQQDSSSTGLGRSDYQDSSSRAGQTYGENVTSGVGGGHSSSRYEDSSRQDLSEMSGQKEKEFGRDDAYTSRSGRSDGQDYDDESKNISGSIGGQGGRDRDY